MDRSADTAHQLLGDTACRLLTRAADGDVDAFASFYDLTCAAAYRLALMLTRDAEAAECLTVLAYERAWAELPTYDAVRSPLVWLLALVRAENRDVVPAA